MTSDPDKADQELFRASVKDVKRLRRQQTPPRRARVSPLPRKTREHETRVREEPFAHDIGADDVEPGDALTFARPGLQHGTMRRLRRGQIAIGADIDLHGMTVPLARRALREFLDRCLDAGTRCVRVIHGKGLSAPDRPPVLKSRVNAWLRQEDGVLAFCSAQPRDGGTGALYVLLKKPR